MNIQQIIRAWQDSAYRKSLSPEQLAQLPANPSGEALSEQELALISGGLLSESGDSLGIACTQLSDCGGTGTGTGGGGGGNGDTADWSPHSPMPPTC